MCNTQVLMYNFILQLFKHQTVISLLYILPERDSFNDIKRCHYHGPCQYVSEYMTSVRQGPVDIVVVFAKPDMCNYLYTQYTYPYYLLYISQESISYWCLMGVSVLKLNVIPHNTVL